MGWKSKDQSMWQLLSSPLPGAVPIDQSLQLLLHRVPLSLSDRQGSDSQRS